MQPRAGRLDLLLKDPETDRRYEVEIQLGKVNESHIIRTLEYWDIERKRYPQFEHCAVIIAEEITSRFLNVISLFNGFIPLIAIQMNAYQFGDDVALVFTKILDEMTLGPDVEEDYQEEKATSTDWTVRWTKDRVEIANAVCKLLNEIDGGLRIDYHKGQIVFYRNEELIPFVRLVPRAGDLLALALTSEKSQEMDSLIETSGLTDMGYNSRNSRYRIRINQEDLAQRAPAIQSLYALVKQQNESET